MKLLELVKGKPKYLIVEVDKPREVGLLDKEMAASVASLREHPGFLYLLAKLRYQRAMLRAHLERTHQTSISEVDFVKSGINWCGWLEEQLAKAAKIETERPQLPPMEAEELAFQEVSKMLEVIGIPVAEQP